MISNRLTVVILPFQAATSNAIIMKLRFIILLWTLIVSLETARGQRVKSSSDRLVEVLFRSPYEPSILPAKSTTDNVTVILSIDPYFIDCLDEEKAIFSIHSTLSLKWTDYRLRWNPSDYDEITAIRIPSRKIWVPDIRVYNSPSKDVDPKGYVNTLLHSTGKITWVAPTKLEFFCPETPPSGLQIEGADRICQASLGSWTYDGWIMDIQLAAVKMRLDDFSNTHPKWKLMTSFAKQDRLVKYYSCCVEPYVTINATFALVRRDSSDGQQWQSVMALPCVITACLSIWTAFSRSAVTSRIRTIGLLLLFLSAILIYVCAQTNLPPTSTNAGVLIIWTTALVFSNIFISSLVCAIMLRPSIMQSSMVTKILSTPIKSVLVPSSEKEQNDNKDSSQEDAEDYSAMRNAMTGIVTLLHAITFITILGVYA